MPKLAQKRADENRRQIEQAAFSLFTRQGFHGTNIREIAEQAQVSTGAIYTYFPTKDALYESVVASYQKAVVHSYQKRIRSWLARQLESSEELFSRPNLEGLAQEIRSFVYQHTDYWKLMYIDVVEFNNQHFAHSFHNVPEQFKWPLDGQLQKIAAHPAWCGIDPGFVLATIYMQILTYFLVERLFGGERHLGVPEDTAIRRIIDMTLNGIWRTGSATSPSAVTDRTPQLSQKRSGHPGKAIGRSQGSGKKSRKPR